MSVETLKDYELVSAEASYENPGEEAPMVCIAVGK